MLIQIQLFREGLLEKVHATIPKGIVVGFEFNSPSAPVSTKKFERMTREVMADMFASAEVY